MPDSTSATIGTNFGTGLRRQWKMRPPSCCGPEHKDARKGKRRGFLVLFDCGLADAGQMLDDLFGRFAGEIV